MKKNFILILFAVTLASCEHPYTHNETILRAEKLLDNRPDSAFRLLNAIPHPEKLPAADYAAWCLHYTRVLIKLNVPVASDSLIRISLNYYAQSNLYTYKGLSYYVSGTIHRLKNQPKEALTDYKIADDLFSHTGDEKLKGLVDFYIGYLSMQDELYKPALDYFKKSVQHFLSANETKYLAYSYREISDMYNQLDYPTDSVMHYSDLALKLSRQSGDTINYRSILLRQGELLYKKDLLRSKESILKALRLTRKPESYYAAILSYIYSKLNCTDSAQFYLNLAFKDSWHENSDYIRYVAGAYVSKAHHDYKQAFNHLESAYIQRDSLFQKKISSQLYRIDVQYDLAGKDRENARLKIQNRNNVILIAVLIIAALVIFIVLLLASAQFKKKKNMQDLENQKIRTEMEKKELENSQNKKLLLSKLQNKIENTLRFNKLQMGLKKQDKFDTFLSEITKQSIISDVEWSHYIDEARRIFGNNFSDLQMNHPNLTYADLKVIALISFEVDIADSSSLLGLTKHALYHRRNIIKNRLGLDDATDLEEWIKKNVVHDSTYGK